MTRRQATFLAMIFPIIAGSMMGLLSSLYDLRAAAIGFVIFVAMLVYALITRISTY